MKTIYSNNITFMDTTDSRRLEVFINSNLPTVQAYNINTLTYSPDWEQDNLVLTPTIFIDSVDVTEQATITWYQRVDSGENIAIATNTKILTIDTNVLSTAVASITYTCSAIYDGLNAVSQMSFSKVDTGADGVAFQIYAPDGYILSKDIPSLTIQTFTYSGGSPIYEGMTYVWSEQINGEWVAMTGKTSDSIVVTRDDVLQSKTYQCLMTYGGNMYYSTITIQDRGDTYNAVACVSSNASASSGEYYWVLYTLVYSETEEKDPLLGDISQVAPETPIAGDYWYAIDTDSMTITLKKYDGAAWMDAVDTQTLSYNWSIVDENNGKTALEGSSKVKLITSRDFTSTVTFLCEVQSPSEGYLAQTALVLTDVSDPIMSEEAPINPGNGQIWIKPNGNESFVLFVWDAVKEMWTIADADARNKVYTSKPTSYSAGDLWITSSNEDHDLYLPGTLLQAQASNTEFSASDWSPSLKYDRDIEEVQTQLNDLSQYITMSSEGLRIRAKTDAGEVSPYNSLFTSTKLAFCDGDTELLTIGKSDDDLDAPSRVIAPEIEVKNDLIVGETFSLGDLRLIIEENGSFSFIVDR